MHIQVFISYIIKVLFKASLYPKISALCKQIEWLFIKSKLNNTFMDWKITTTFIKEKLILFSSGKLNESREMHNRLLALNIIQETRDVKNVVHLLSESIGFVFVCTAESHV